MEIGGHVFRQTRVLLALYRDEDIARLVRDEFTEDALLESPETRQPLTVDGQVYE